MLKNNSYRSSKGYIIDKRGNEKEIIIPYFKCLEGMVIKKLTVSWWWKSKNNITEKKFKNVCLLCKQCEKNYSVLVFDECSSMSYEINIPIDEKTECWYFKAARLPSNLVVKSGSMEYIFEI